MSQSSHKINCRRCGKETVFSIENPFRPFCSERCKLIDLGQWASEDYRIASQDSGSIQELAEQMEDEYSRRESEENAKKN
jgi:endogenous inhibitor of DNA gyrase (YacG/DUF329 family)